MSVCDGGILADALQVERHPDLPARIVLAIDGNIRRSGRTLRLVQADGGLPGNSPDATLVRLLLLARRWWRELRQGETDITALATRKGCSPSYVTRIVRLAFLSPQVTSAILHGKQRAGVDGATLTLGENVPVLWSEQAKMLLCSGTG